MRRSVPPSMRIGELANRVGVSTHVLRAWESRYGLLTPSRSSGGYRLYGLDDERRVREVLALRDQGVSAMEAARQVLAAERAGAAAAGEIDELPADDTARPASGSDPGMRVDPPMLVTQLLDAITALDEDRAHAVLDTAFLDRSVESAVVDVLVPFFVKVGEQWELGRIGIAQEHFASSLVRRRLGALSMTWGLGTGPVAVLACPPGEFHDIILLSFGVLLGRAGWRVRYLGPDTPIPSLTSAADLTGPDAVVIASRRPSGFRAHARALRSLGERHPVWLAGRGTTPRILEEIRAHHLGPDLVADVQMLTDFARERRRAALGRREEPSEAAGPSAAAPGSTDRNGTPAASGPSGASGTSGASGASGASGRNGSAAPSEVQADSEPRA